MVMLPCFRYSMQIVPGTASISENVEEVGEIKIHLDFNKSPFSKPILSHNLYYIHVALHVLLQ